MPPGSVMQIADHINYSGMNPLIGEESDDRFVGMTNAYDAELVGSMRSGRAQDGDPAVAAASTCGSPARASKRRRKSAWRACLGADAVGMSTVPEVHHGALSRPEGCGGLRHHQLWGRHDRRPNSATRKPRTWPRSAVPGLPPSLKEMIAAGEMPMT